jgi:type II secretory pathway pseudopilin PulG
MTLVEIMVSLVLLSIFATVVFQIIQWHGGFLSLQTSREEVQQNARGAIQVMGGELRALHPSGIASATSTSITAMVPRAWGVSCGGGTGAVSGAQFNAAFPPSDTTGFSSISGLLADVTAAGAGTTLSPTASDGTYATITARSYANPATTAQCNGLSVAGTTLGYRFTVDNMPVIPPAGNLVMIYEKVTYDVGTNSADGKPWLRRSYGTGAQQPLAGPLRSDTSLAFRYYDASGALLTTPLSAADMATVRRIGIRVTTKATAHDPTRTVGSTQYNYQTTSDSVTVYLRNQP